MCFDLVYVSNEQFQAKIYMYVCVCVLLEVLKQKYSTASKLKLFL